MESNIFLKYELDRLLGYPGVNYFMSDIRYINNGTGQQFRCRNGEP